VLYIVLIVFYKINSFWQNAYYLKKPFFNVQAVKKVMDASLTDLRFHMICLSGDNVKGGFVFGTSQDGSAIGLHYFFY
jgi:hypothetical protein